MIGDSKERLLEQYEDAAFALYMDAYAEQEGARLLREFEEAKRKGEVPEGPAARDNGCVRLVHRTFKKQRRMARAKRILRTLGRTAAVLLIAVGICTSLAVSVDAIRVPVFNFLIEQNKGYISIFLDQDTDADGQPDTKGIDNSLLAPFVPDGFTLYRHDIRKNGLFTIVYSDPNGNRITLTTLALDGTLSLDMEGATTEHIEIAGCGGILVTQEDMFKITWADEERELCYLLIASGLDRETFWQMAEQIAQAGLG